MVTNFPPEPQRYYHYDEEFARIVSPELEKKFHDKCFWCYHCKKWYPFTAALFTFRIFFPARTMENGWWDYDEALCEYCMNHFSMFDFVETNEIIHEMLT